MADDSKTRERLLDTQREREERLRSLARLAGRMAHDFNNVLMGIQPFVEVLARQNPDNAGVQKAVERIGLSIQRGKQLTDEVLALTRPRPLVRKPVDVAELLESIRQTDKEIEIDIREPLAVDVDSGQIRQTLLNLMANARQAMGGAGMVKIAAQRGSGDGLYPFGVVESPERFAHLTLSDRGAGMPEEAMTHRFEPMFTTHRPAVGMGLALAHQIVTQHGGAIFIESVAGAGTSVHLFLPITLQAV